MRKVLAIVVATVGGLCACNAAEPVTEPSNPLRDELIMLVGPDALDCGFVPIGTDPADAWSCAESAVESGAPHWFAMQFEGVDSDVWQASLLTYTGQRFILNYDSNYMGGSGLMPRFSRDTCNGRIVLTQLRTRPGVELQCSRK